MPINDYIFDTDTVFYKHDISKKPPCNAYSMHTHNTFELIYFVSGDATHVIEDKKYKLKPGDLILIRPLRYHFIQIDSPADYERYDILFDAEKHSIEGTDLISDDLEVINIAGNTIAEEIFNKIDLYNKKCDSRTFEKLLSHLISELFYNIHIFPQFSPEESTSLSPTISHALKYINDNLYTISGIEEIAKHLFVSESYLFRLFKSELHQTPKKYILHKRLLMAKKLITAGEKPTLVCTKCGFYDYTSFYRNYVSFFGYPPSNKAL